MAVSGVIAYGVIFKCEHTICHIGILKWIFVRVLTHTYFTIKTPPYLWTKYKPLTLSPYGLSTETSQVMNKTS